ncbi:MAG TPA: substrate-binding domain-containing protein [Clostridia bacterium]
MKKRVIGCIVDNVEGGYNRNLWNIIRNAAKNADCSLRAFEGRHLRDAGYDGRHNAIYALAEKYRPDGWLILGTQIVNHVTLEEYAAFCSRFCQSVPMVSLGVELPGTASVLLDNGQGIKRLLEHLIRTHGYSRIAFIKGPERNFEAIERYRVYRAVMAAHRIEVDPNLIFEGNFGPMQGYNAYRKLYESGFSCDCIICANDDTIAGES